MGIDQGQIGINAFPDIDPMAVIFSSGQNKALLEQVPGINIHRPFITGRKMVLDRIGRQLNLSQIVLLNKLFKTEKTPEQGIAHFVVIVGGKIKWKP